MDEAEILSPWSICVKALGYEHAWNTCARASKIRGDNASRWCGWNRGTWVERVWQLGGRFAIDNKGIVFLSMGVQFCVGDFINRSDIVIIIRHDITQTKFIRINI